MFGLGTMCAAAHGEDDADADTQPDPFGVLFHSILKKCRLLLYLRVVGIGKINENSMSLEVLDFLLMLFGFFESLECSEVASLSSRHVFFTGIKAILAGFQFPYHACVDALCIRMDVFA